MSQANHDPDFDLAEESCQMIRTLLHLFKIGGRFGFNALMIFYFDRGVGSWLLDMISL